MTPDENDIKTIMEDSDILESYEPEQFRMDREFKDGVVFVLRPVTPEEMEALYADNSIQVWSPQKRKKIDKLTDVGEIEFLKLAVRGWRGLTWEIVNKWMLGFDAAKKGKTGPVEFKVATMWKLMKKVNGLSVFIFDTVTLSEEMTEEIQEKQSKNL